MGKNTSYELSINMDTVSLLQEKKPKFVSVALNDTGLHLRQVLTGIWSFI